MANSSYTVKTGSARDRVKAYEADMQAYVDAHQQDYRGTPQQNPDPQAMVGGWGQQGTVGPSADYHDPAWDWINSLPPEVLADYHRVAQETQGANKSASQKKFAIMLAAAATAGAGGAALGLGEAAAAPGGASAYGGLEAMGAGGAGAGGASGGAGAFMSEGAGGALTPSGAASYSPGLVPSAAGGAGGAGSLLSQLGQQGIGQTIGQVGSLAGLANSVLGNQQPGGKSNYVPQGTGAADAAAQQNLAANQGQLGYGGGLANIVDPALKASFDQAQAINYQPYLNASNQAGQQYGQLANQAGAAGAQMMGQAAGNFGQQQNLQAAGNQLWNTAQDPQQALYQRTQQQLQDQVNAQNSMYGLGQSGAGAGIANQAMSNFNIDWQNQQLARQLQGAQGMSQLNQTGNQSGALGAADVQAGMGYYGQQPGFTQQAAGVPLQAQQMVAGMPAQNASMYASGLQGAMAPYGNQQSNAQQYMNMGIGAGSQAFNNQLQQSQFNAQNQGGWANAVGNAFGGNQGIQWGQIGSLFGNAPNANYGGNSASLQPYGN